MDGVGGESVGPVGAMPGAGCRVLLIDNYDSFTYNLFQHLTALGAQVDVRRNDRVTLDEMAAAAPTHLVISPGPRTPDHAGVSLAAIARFAGELPILGVCLGHQAIGQAFGGRVVRGREPVHGKTSPVTHDGRTVFRGVEQPTIVTRYHSLVVDPAGASDLEVSAWCDGDVVMGLRHRTLPVEGVQFHPESILSGAGMRMLANFLVRAA